MFDCKRFVEGNHYGRYLPPLPGCLGTESDDGVRFNPSFPSGCPFVTSVGATQVNPGSSVTDPEGACEQVIFSGGGFSNIFALPDFQKSAVESFLANHPPPFTSDQFNNSGTVSLELCSTRIGCSC